MLRQKNAFFGMILFAVGLSGCSGQDPAVAPGECPNVQPPPVASSAPPTTTPPGQSVDLAACSGAATQEQIDKELEIVSFLSTDFHEMVVCGGLANRFAYELIHFFASIGCGEPTNPVGLIFSGLGTFLAGGVMQINVKLAKDSNLGKAGDPVPFDLFSIGSYGAGISVKAEITADTSWSTEGEFAAHVDGTYEISVDAPNPDALGLWGIAATGKVSKTQAELAQAIAENVVFSLDIEQESSQGVKYRIVSPDFSPADLYNGTGIDLPLTFLEAIIPETNQKTTLDHWGIRFVPEQIGILDGSIGVKVDGGSVPFYAVYSYAQSGTPSVAVSCNPPAP